MKKKAYNTPSIKVVATEPYDSILLGASVQGNHNGFIPGQEDDEDEVSGDDAR